MNASHARRARGSRTIATQVIVLQLLVAMAIVVAMSFTYARHVRRQIDRSEAQRVLSIARTVAALPQIRDAFEEVDPPSVIQPIAERVRRASNADFVVVANREQIRYSHPDPSKIGQRLSTDAGIAMLGRDWTGIETGTLGRSVRGKTPVWDAAHRKVIGVVSVGILSESVRATVFRAMKAFILTALFVLACVAAAGYVIWRRVRRQTFSLNSDEIARLLEHREALLHGIKEGIVALDTDHRVTLINDEAARLLDLSVDVVGRPVRSLGLTGRLLDVMLDPQAEEDAIVLHGDRLLTLNRMPVRRDRLIGAVVTLRDRTEMVRLEAELQGAQSTFETLRVQAHEFSNRMHTVAGLLALQEYDEASRYVQGAARAQDVTTAAILQRIAEPTLAALLVAKSALARDRGIELILGADSNVPASSPVPVEDVALVVGNLIDNAVQAIDGVGGWVEVDVRADDERIDIEVADSGPGVAPALAAEVFEFGYTTKAAAIDQPRGLGLALARRACVRHHGTIEVRESGAGAVFVASIPLQGAGEGVTLR